MIVLLIWPLYINDLYLIVLWDNRPVLLWAFDCLFFTIIPSATLFWLICTKQITLAEIGLTARLRVISIITGLVLAPVLIIIVFYRLGPALENLMPGRIFPGYVIANRDPWRWILIVYASVTAGVLEEVVYRGVVISQLQKHLGSGVGVVLLSSIIFGGAHWGEGPGKVVTCFIWAIPIGFWFLRKKSLWGPIVLHTLTDLLFFAQVM